MNNDTKLSYLNMYEQFLVNQFTWSNLPEGIDSQMMERMFYDNCKIGGGQHEE